MDSSDESFVWTNASSESDDSGEMRSPINDVERCNEDAMNFQTKKDVLESNESSEIETEMKVKKRKHEYESSDAHEIDSPKKKKIKTEPESETDAGKKKKKKKKYKDVTNGSLDDSFNEEDIYLDIKVKQEQKYQDSLDYLKPKKNQNVTLSESIDNHETTLEINGNGENEKKTKKKKKHSKDNSKSEEMVVNRSDHSEADTRETIKKSPKKKKRKGNILSDQSEDIVGNKFTAVKNNNSNQAEVGVDINNYDLPEEDSVTHNLTIDLEPSNHNRSNADSSNSVINNNIGNVSSHEYNNIDDKQRGKSITHRQPKLSDRIKFEEEIDSGSHKNEPLSTRLRKFLGENVTLQAIQKNLNKDLEITDDDEIWLLKCPHDVDLNELNNSDINLDNKSKIKINGKTYCGTLNDNNDNVKINVLSSDKYGFKIKNLVSKGIIHFKKRIPKPHFHEDNVMVNNQTDFIPLPETKCRHPLFGPNYKDAIHVPVKCLQPPDNDLNTSFSSEKKKRKKKKKDYDERPEILQPKIEYDSEASVKKAKVETDPDVPKKKAKKRKVTNDEYIPSKKSKKIQLEPDSAEAWASERAIEENLFNF